MIFNDPQELLDKCEDYFKWVDENPWYKFEVLKGGDKAGELVHVPTQRPYTLIALSHHIGINKDTWYEYEKKPDFSDVCIYVHDIIRNQKFEGASVGAFNHSIIARDLGLSDNQNTRS